MLGRGSVWAVLAVVALGVLLPVGPVEAEGNQDETEAVSYDAIDDAGEPIETLTVPVDAAGAAVPKVIQLAQSGGEAREVTFTAPNLTVSPESVVVPPEGERVAVTVTAGTSAQTIERIPLYVNDSSGSHRLLSVLVTRESTLELVSPAPAGITESTWPVPSFTSSMRLHSKGEAALTVRVRYEPLDNDGQTVDLRLQRDGVDVDSETDFEIGPDGFANLTVSADLPEAGTYTSRVEFRTGEPATILTVPISVTRTNAALGLSMDASGTERAETGSPATVQLNGKETTGRSVELVGASLVMARFDDGSGVRNATGLSVSVTHDSEDVAGVVLPPNEPFALVATIEGFESPGTYTASIRLKDDNGSIVDIPVTIQVRDDWGLAATWIAIGVILSALIAWVGGTLLSKVEERAGATALAQRVNAILDRHPPPLPARLEQAGAVLLGRLEQVADGSASADQVAEVLKATRAHLELLDLLVAAWRAVVRGGTPNPADNPDIATALRLLDDKDTDPTKVAEAESKLRAILTKATTLASDEGLAHVRSQLEGVMPQLPQEVKTRVKDLLDEALATTGEERQAMAAKAEAAAADALLDKTRLEATEAHRAASAAFEAARAGLASGVPRTLDDVRTVQRAVVEGLRTELARVVEMRSNPDDYQREAVAEAGRMRVKLEAAAALAAKDPSAALAELVEVARWANTARGLLGDSPDRVTTDLELLGEAPPALLPAGELGTGVYHRWTPVGSADAHTAKLIRVLLWVVIGAATVALGVFSLYASDATWGSGLDKATALLWGLGVTASGVSGAVGLAGARKSLGLGGAGAA